MPIKKSAKKYMRVTKKKTERNRKVRGLFRKAIKKAEEAVKAADPKKAQEYLKIAIKQLDKATQKKVIKKNTAARKKSRLNKKVKNLTKKK